MNAREALRELGAAARGMRVVRRLHVAPVKCSYLVERGSTRFVLRIDQSLARTLGLDRRVEARVLRAAAQAGAGPEPIAMRVRAPAILLTRYVLGRAWTRADLDDPCRLGQLATLLRHVHTISPAGVPRLDLAQAAARYARLADPGAIGKSRLASRLQEPAHAALERSGVGATRVATLVGEVAGLLARAHDSAATPVLCHNDPIAANVIGFRRPQLIDWEYAAAGDPLFDLAVVIEHHRLNRRLAHGFAATYFGSAIAVPKDRLAGYRAVYQRVRALWDLAVQQFS